LYRVGQGHEILLIGNIIGAASPAAIVGLVPDGIRQVVVTYPGRHVIRARVRGNFLIHKGTAAQAHGPDLILPSPGNDQGAHNNTAINRYIRATTPTRIIWVGRHGRVVRRFRGGRPEST
jgi:hypothetical protein